jgi:hypothetical protein
LAALQEVAAVLFASGSLAAPIEGGKGPRCKKCGKGPSWRAIKGIFGTSETIFGTSENSRSEKNRSQRPFSELPKILPKVLPKISRTLLCIFGNSEKHFRNFRKFPESSQTVLCIFGTSENFKNTPKEKCFEGKMILSTRITPYMSMHHPP